MGKLVKVDVSELSNLKRKRTDNLKILEEFMAMEVPCVEYTEFTQKTGYICQRSFELSARRYGFKNIQASCRNGHVYLIRKDLIGKVKF